MDSIQYIERNTGELVTEQVPSGATLKWLYTSKLGKLALHALLKRKFVSVLAGWYMNRKISKGQIHKFIQNYQLDMSVYQKSDIDDFATFNDFFYRKIRKDKRPVGQGIVSPADGKLFAFESLSALQSFFVKGRQFSLEDFLQDKQLTAQFAGGALVIVRLAPTDYHRFHFPAPGLAHASVAIKGNYYSVSPLALRKSLEIFCDNYRERAILQTTDFGKIGIVEVGATMVGSIKQTYQTDSQIAAGQEKGYFAFGGSTVVLCFEPGKIKLSADLLKNSEAGYETTVKMGEQIGHAVVHRNPTSPTE